MAGKRNVILAPVPEIRKQINKYILLAAAADDHQPTISRTAHDEITAEVMARLATYPGARLGGGKALCDDTTCYGAGPEGSYYFDNNHPSVLGAAKLVERWLE